MATPRAPIPYSRVLFTDHCFPACSPDFLKRFPQAVTPEGLAAVPLVGIDWGGGYASEPQWCEWFESQGVRPAPPVRPVAVYSLSGLALDAAVDGRGRCWLRPPLPTTTSAEGGWCGCRRTA